MLLMFAGMLLAIKRRYLWILPIGLITAYTRPGVLALGLALGIVFLVRFFRRKVDPFPMREWLSLMASGLVIAVAGLSWNHIAQYVTGTHNAYIRTELGWWLDYVGNDEFTPFTRGSARRVRTWASSASSSSSR